MLTRDKNGVMLSIGDNVLLIPSMAFEGQRHGRIFRIIGEDIHVNILIRDYNVQVHRYASDMEKI